MVTPLLTCGNATEPLLDEDFSTVMPQPIPPRHPLIRGYLRSNRSLAETTRTSHQSILNRWALWLETEAANGRRDADVRTASRQDVEDYLDHLLTDRQQSPVTVNTQRAALRAFYRWAKDTKEIKKDPAKNVNSAGAWESLPPVLTDAEYKALMKACDDGSDLGRRDAAILSLLRWQGLRRGEVIGLDLESYHYSDGDNAYIVVGTAQHRTKTRKQRRVPLHPDTVDRIEAYIWRRGEAPGPLFMSAYTDDGRLTRSGMTQIMEKLRRRAKLPTRVGIHSFRRAWIIDLKRKGVGDRECMIAGGWSNPMMVHRYTKSANEELAFDAIRATFPDPAKKPRRPRLRRVS